MKQPRGFEDPEKPKHVCRLTKAIYGLRQALRSWYERLKATLIKWGFHNAISDTSLFVMKNKDQVVFILIYVDDILVIGNNTDFLQSFTQKLNDTFSLKDLGELHYFLGVEVVRNDTGMYLC